MSWRGHMFGVAVESDCELVGCFEAQSAEELPRLTLLETGAARITRAGHALTRLADGRPDLRREPAGGYVLEARGLADFHISRDGKTVRYAADDAPPWRWQRYLLGRVLPLAATLLGREPLHASAVALEEGAVVLAGESGSGKTTLAAELVLAGLGFIADDVVAMSREDGRLLAHPGPGLMSQRRPLGLGEVVGGDAEGLWVAVERKPAPLPVRALYLLEPGRTAPTVSAVPDPEPAALLSTSFNLALRDPARLARQLDVFAALSAVRVARVTVPDGADFSALASMVLADLYRCEVAA